MGAPKGHSPYPGCERGGRPRKWTDVVLEEEAEKLQEWIDEDQNNLFIQDFCLSRGYHDQKVSEWCNQCVKFRDAYNLLMTRQKMFLIKGGLSRKLFFPMCALLLSNNHGMALKTEQKITTDTTVQSIMEQITDTSKEIVIEPLKVSDAEER